VKFLSFATRTASSRLPQWERNAAPALSGNSKPSEIFKTKAEAGGEQLLFVWRGAIQVKDKTGSYSAGERTPSSLPGLPNWKSAARPGRTSL